MGFAFKSNTNDTRESPAINICKDLIAEGANLHIYDPKVSPNQITTELKINQTESDLNSDLGTWCFADSINESIKNSHCVVIITEWKEFMEIDWYFAAKEMFKPAWIFDTRGVANKDKVKAAGLNIWCIGNGNV